jgi:hypothetical protein
MAARIAGVLAVVGGAAWLVKFVLIWENGGTNTTDGLVGVLFDVGAVAILLALGVNARWAPKSGITAEPTDGGAGRDGGIRRSGESSYPLGLGALR